MAIHLLGFLRHAHSCPVLSLRLCATTAIRYYVPDDLSTFGPPEIVWRRSSGGMALVQPARFGESEHVLLVLDQNWQPRQDPRRAIAAALAEAELEYELLRPGEPRALVVRPQDASFGLPLGQECWLGRSSVHSYGAADIERIRNALRLNTRETAEPHQGEVDRLAGKPLTAEGQSRAREIVAAWDRHQAADVVALATSGLAIWRRMAVNASCDPMRSEPRIFRQTAAHNKRDAFL